MTYQMNANCTGFLDMMKSRNSLQDMMSVNRTFEYCLLTQNSVIYWEIYA